MEKIASRVLVLSVIFLPLGAVRQGHSQSEDNLTSPVTTLEAFRKARSLGDQAESLPEKAKHWRLALSWQAKHVEWLHLARKFAGDLRNVAHDPNDPRFKEYKAIYRKMINRFDHMDFYKKNGADTYWEDSMSLPAAACVGLCDYPLCLDMMQDFYDRRVKDWLNEPVPVKESEPEFFFRPRHKYISYEQRVANWLERRIRALEGQLFTMHETQLIDLAARQYAYLCRNDNEDKNPVPGLTELGTRYTAPAILTALQKHVKVESPPFPRMLRQLGQTIELTIHGDRLDQTHGPSKIDFDTGTVVDNHLEWSSRPQQSIWMKRGGLDISVDHHWRDLMRFVAFDCQVIEVPETLWDEKPASWEQLKASEIKKGTLRVASRGGVQMQYSIVANTPLPATFAFKTREGGQGLLQLTEMKEPVKNVREYSIRYRLSATGKLSP